MIAQVFLRTKRLSITVVTALVLSSEFLSAQVTVSAGPLPLYEVKTIYIASPSDDFGRMLKSRFEKWGAVTITAQLEEADAILTCETETRFVPAKVVVRVIDAQVRLVDRHTQRLIWSTKKSTSWENRLADEIVDQLKKDREKAVGNY